MMAPFAKVFGGIATVLVTLLLIGFVLPGTWSAEASIQIEASPTEVFPFLNDLSRWDTWTNWGDLDSELSDPSGGVGASRRWDDPNFGSGSVTIVSSEPTTFVRYEVEIEGGASVGGELSIEALGGESRVTWREEGDFGRNPLMGYVARGMAKSQGAQLAEGLEKLRYIF
jgi:hypothetical protein